MSTTTPTAPATPVAPAPRYAAAPVVRIVPTFPGTTPGGLDVWTRVFCLQAKTHFCLEIILPSAVASSSASTSTGTSAAASAAASKFPSEGDANCQNRLANLLYEWTDKTNDWPLFQRCRINSPTLGEDICGKLSSSNTSLPAVATSAFTLIAYSSLSKRMNPLPHTGPASSPRSLTSTHQVVLPP